MVRSSREIKRDIATEIRRAIRTRQMIHRDIAREAQITTTNISAYIHDKRTPRHDVALRLSEALSWPKIAELSLELHSHPCLVCGRITVDAGQQYKKKYCSSACHSTWASRVARQKRVGKVMEREAYRGRRLKLYEDVIKAYCDECTGMEGICRDDECSLREVSPLPFVALVARKKSA